MLQIRPMTPADRKLGRCLVEQAGWNQTAADWRRIYALGHRGCFVAEWAGAGVGTVTTALFGRVGWVAMLLVDASHRGRGIGRALMGRAIASLEERGAATIRLDATDHGRPMYERLGFGPDYRVARHAGEARAFGADDRIRKVQRLEDWFRIRDRDFAATGTRRGALLATLAPPWEDRLRVADFGGGADGFVIVRPGRIASQIGPCIADAAAGPLLLADASTRLAGRPVFLDIPEDHAAASAFARSAGLSVARLFLRMTRGRPLAERRDLLWASSGPEMG